MSKTEVKSTNTSKSSTKKKIIEAIIGIIAVALLVLIDQYTKILAVEKLSDGSSYPLIKNVLEFYFIKNQGAAWGILSGKRTVFIIITIIVMLVILYVYMKTPKTKKYMMLAVTEVLLFSGAIGNFIDRIKLAYVRDFIYFKIIDFPVFNVADIYVVISAISLIILVLFIYKDEDFDFLTFKKKEK